MCHPPKNEFHTLYYAHHSLDRIEEDIRRHHLDGYKKGTVFSLYDLRTVRIRYDYGNYQKQRLADIIIPAYIHESKYHKIIQDLTRYFDNKEFSILQEDDDYVYLYHDGECVNTLINNLIVYYQTS